MEDSDDEDDYMLAAQTRQTDGGAGSRPRRAAARAAVDNMKVGEYGWGPPVPLSCGCGFPRLLMSLLRRFIVAVECWKGGVRHRGCEKM